MPPTPLPTLRERLQILLSPPSVYGVSALALIGMAAFILTVTYFQNAQAESAAQAAAAAQVVPSAFDGTSIEARAAIVVDQTNGKVLYEKSADAQLPLASITKVMTVLAVSEVLRPTDVITIPYDTSPEGSAERLAKGERWRVQDVINFTLIASSNEGANILALAANAKMHEKYADSPEQGAVLWRMNQLASEIGMENAYFLNYNGLDQSLTQAGSYASARDVAKMFEYAEKTDPAIFAGTTKDGLLLASRDGGTTTAFNTNEALGQIPGLIMGKTGFTDLAGGNLAVMFDVGLAHPVTVVVLGSSVEGRFSDVRDLVQRARRSIAE